MKNKIINKSTGSLLAVCLALIPASAAQETAIAQYWGQWRGPEATGISRTATPPIEWSETENIRWKIEIPGRGMGSPVVWGDRIFLTTAIPVGVDPDTAHQPRGGITEFSYEEFRHLHAFGVHRFVVMAIARRDGSILWEHTVREETPHEPVHPENGTWASSSAITDGKHVFAYFGSRGLFAFTLDGELLWEKDLGDTAMRRQFGEGSTPVLYKDRLVVVWDHLGGQSFIVALNKNSGDELWRVNRNEIDTWATPLVVESMGQTQVVVPGMERLISYDLADGSIVWESDGLTMNPIPSPVYSDGIVIAMSGYRGNNLKAVRLSNARGNITGTEAIVWELDQDTPYVSSPLLYDGTLYFLKTNSPILSAFDAGSGEPKFQRQRVPGVPSVFASPVGADGRLYITGRNGTTVVIRHGPVFEILSTNMLDDGFDASPALVGNEIYLRGHKYLYSISTEQEVR